MFTGLIQEVGIIDKAQPQEEGLQILIQASGDFLKELKLGDSVAVNGVCQSIEKVENDCFQVFSVPETLKVTNLANLREAEYVNLELPLRPIDRLGGHIVQGHIENTAEIKSIDQHPKYWDIVITYADPAILPKGSVALDGISLTVQEVTKESFSIQIIPETLKKTNIPNWREGRKVNIETDYLVKAILYNR